MSLCVCVMCPTSKPQTQTHGQQQARPKLVLLLGSVEGFDILSFHGMSITLRRDNFNHPATTLSCVGDELTEEARLEFNFIQFRFGFCFQITETGDRKWGPERLRASRPLCVSPHRVICFYTGATPCIYTICIGIPAHVPQPCLYPLHKRKTQQANCN